MDNERGRQAEPNRRKEREPKRRRNMGAAWDRLYEWFVREADDAGADDAGTPASGTVAPDDRGPRKGEAARLVSMRTRMKRFSIVVATALVLMAGAVQTPTQAVMDDTIL